MNIDERYSADLGYGVGLRQCHWDYVLSNFPEEVEWFEIISENFIYSSGKAAEVLARIRERYPISMHGVSLSIGSTDPLNYDYLHKLKALSNWLDPCWISDHVCWTGVNTLNTHDLLPVPYTEDSLKNMIKKVREVQDFLERPLMLENPSNYMEFQANTIPEWEFISTLVREADCYMLLDVNNLYVTCFNHGLDCKEYIDRLPTDKIREIHIAGHEHHGTHIVDTHDSHPCEDVLDVYSYAISTHGKRSTLLEWDAKIPTFETMIEDLNKIRTRHIGGSISVKDFRSRKDSDIHHCDNLQKDTDGMGTNAIYDKKRESFNDLLNIFQNSILLSEKSSGQLKEQLAWVKTKSYFPSRDQIEVYRTAYRGRLTRLISKFYPVTRSILGDDMFESVLDDYVSNHPSRYFSIDDYIYDFADGLSSLDNIHRDIIMDIAFFEREIQSLRREEISSEAMSLEGFLAKAAVNTENMGVALVRSAKVLHFQSNVHYVYTDCYSNGSVDLDDDDLCKRDTYIALLYKDGDVHRRVISFEEYSILSIIGRGVLLSDIIEKVMETLCNNSSEKAQSLVSDVLRDLFQLEMLCDFSCNNGI